VLDNTNGEVLMGGAMDEDDLFIEPPVVQVKTVNTRWCSQVSFGPFIPILAVDNSDEAIKLANGLVSTPLKLIVLT
jgi:beta-apo-4'-carotenal oxygenase